MKRTYPRLFFVKLQMRIDPKPWSFELFRSSSDVQTRTKIPLQKKIPFHIGTVTENLLYPTTSLLVFRRYFAGMGASRRQVMFIGLLPSCFT